MSTFKISGTTFHVDRKYQPIKALGQGAYGVVCAAKDRSNGTKVAIKRINPMAVNSVVAKQALREIRLLRHLGRHSNIIALKDLSVREADDELYVIMELMDTDLHRIIQSSQTLTDAHHKHFMYQLIRGLNFAHKHGVIHRDLKPSNLLVSKNCDLVITDFGLSRLAPEEEDALMTEHVVTRWYRPPELMLCADGNYTSAVDMWSVGCIFAELLGRKPLFPGKNFMHQLCLIFEVIGTPPKSELGFIKSEQAMTFMRGLDTIEKTPFKVLFPYANPKAVDLLEQCLKFTPGERITVEEALEHPYFASVASQYTDPDPVLDETFEFEFENQKLRKGDLRQLIVEEVKSFRAEVGGKKPRRTSSSSSTASGGAPAVGSGAGTAPSGRSTSRGRSRERGSYTRGTAASRSRSRGSRGRSGSRGSSSSLLAKAEADRARRRSGSRDSRGSRGSTGSGSMRRSHSARDRSSSNPRAVRRGSSTARDARGRDDPGDGERGRGGGIRDSVSGSAASRVIGADAAMNPHHSRRGQHPTTNPSTSHSRMATTNPHNNNNSSSNQQSDSTRGSRNAAHKTSTNNHPSHRRAPSSAWSEAGTGIRSTSTAAAAAAPASSSSSSAARRSSPYKTTTNNTSSSSHLSPSRSRPAGHATSPDVAASPPAAAAEPPSPPTAQQQQQLPPKPAPAFTDPPSPQRKPGRRTGNAAASPRRGYPSPAHSRGGGGVRSGAPPPSPARRAAAAPSAWSPPAAGLASSSAAVAAAIAASPRRPGAAATSSSVPPSPSVSPVNTAQAKTQPPPSPAVRRAVASAAVLRPSPSRGIARSASSPSTRKSPPSFTKAQQRRQQLQHRTVAGVDMLEGDDDDDEDEAGAGLDALLGSVGVAGRGLIPTPRPASTSSPARRTSPRATPAKPPAAASGTATLHSRVEEAAAAAEAALARNPASYQFRSGVTVPRPFNFATSRRTRSSRSLATSGAGEPSAAAAAAAPSAPAARAVTATAGADRSSVLRRQGSGGVTSRHTTAVKPFNFATSSRQRSREQLTHASAHPRGYAAGTASSKSRRKRTTTVARSPQFSKMSWQKRAGSRPSGTTTSGSAAGTAAARARRARSAARTRSTRVY